MTEDQFYKPANLYAGSNVNLAEELSRKRENRFPSEKLIKDLQDRYSDLFEAFNEGARHGFKSRDAEVSALESALEDVKKFITHYYGAVLSEGRTIAFNEEMTVGKLEKILANIKDKRAQVVVDKESLWDGNKTFTICRLESSEYTWVNLCDGDGFVATTKRGLERGSFQLILKG